MLFEEQNKRGIGIYFDEEFSETMEYRDEHLNSEMYNILLKSYCSNELTIVDVLKMKTSFFLFVRF